MLWKFFFRICFICLVIHFTSLLAEIESSLDLEVYSQQTLIFQDNNKDSSSWSKLDSSPNRRISYGENAILPDSAVHYNFKQYQYFPSYSDGFDELMQKSSLVISLRQSGLLRLDLDSSIEGDIWQISGALEKDIDFSDSATNLNAYREAWIQALVLRNNVYLKLGADQYLDKFIQGYSLSKKASIGSNAFGLYSLQSTEEAIFPSFSFGLSTSDFKASYSIIDSRFFEENSQSFEKLIQTYIRGKSYTYDDKATSLFVDALSGYALSYDYSKEAFRLAFEHYSLEASQKSPKSHLNIQHTGNYADKKFWGIGSSYKFSQSIESFINLNYTQTEVGEDTNQEESLGVYSQNLEVVNFNLGGILKKENYKLLFAITHTQLDSSLSNSQDKRLVSSQSYDGQICEIAYYRLLNEFTQLELGAFSSSAQKESSGLADSRYEGLSILISYASST